MNTKRAGYTTADNPAGSELDALRRFAEIMLDKVNDHPAIKQPPVPGGVLVEICVWLTVGEIEILRKLVTK